MTVQLPNFDMLLDLARNDPGELENLRNRLTEMVIANAQNPDSQRKLRGLQFRINAEIRRSRSPLDAALRVSDLMCRSLTRLRHAIVDPDALLGPVPSQGPKVVSLAGAAARRSNQHMPRYTQTPGTGL
ncbi:MAG: DUF3135 domain-containing protein [Pseudomonadales bacterium]